jgi:hypothetical protein
MNSTRLYTKRLQIEEKYRFKPQKPWAFDVLFVIGICRHMRCGERKESILSAYTRTYCFTLQFTYVRLQNGTYAIHSVGRAIRAYDCLWGKVQFTYIARKLLHTASNRANLVWIPCFRLSTYKFYFGLYSLIFVYYDFVWNISFYFVAAHRSSL